MIPNFIWKLFGYKIETKQIVTLNDEKIKNTWDIVDEIKENEKVIDKPTILSNKEENENENENEKEKEKEIKTVIFPSHNKEEKDLTIFSLLDLLAKENQESSISPQTSLLKKKKNNFLQKNKKRNNVAHFSVQNI